MISSIFGKTKPINHIIVLTFLSIFYISVFFLLPSQANAKQALFTKTLALVVLLGSVYLVNFIIQRNKITGPNAFSILFYAALIVLFPETILDSSVIFCSLFIILATRRLISIKSLLQVKLKIFDATLLVLIASLFYDWALLFLLLVLVAIYIYEPKNVKNWFVPFSSIFTFASIVYAALLIIGQTEFVFNHYQFNLDLNIKYFLNWTNSARFLVFVLIVLSTSIYSFLKLSKLGLGKIVTMRLVGLAFVIGILFRMLVLKPNSDPLLITFLPATIFITNYVEGIQKPKLKEFILILGVVIPLLVFFTTVL